jgi:hypothetical protein
MALIKEQNVRMMRTPERKALMKKVLEKHLVKRALARLIAATTMRLTKKWKESKRKETVRRFISQLSNYQSRARYILNRHSLSFPFFDPSSL